MKTAVLLGAGGLGCPAALALAEEKDGLRLIIVDPDRIERSNLARQILYGEADIGAAKAEIAARRTGAEARVERFDEATANELLRDADVLLDGTDDFETRFLANDEALRRGIPLVHGAALGWFGQLVTVLPGRTACLRCLFEGPRTSRPPARTPACPRRSAAWSALPWRARPSLSCAASPMQACSTAGTRAPAGTVLSR